MDRKWKDLDEAQREAVQYLLYRQGLTRGYGLRYINRLDNAHGEIWKNIDKAADTLRNCDHD
jgi:hypothetical protein